MLLYRDILLTSAQTPERFVKAKEVKPDLCLVNCEDPIPQFEEDKARARKVSLEWLQQEHEEPPYGIMINCLRTRFGFQDVLALQESGARPEYILMAKVEDPEEIRIVHEMLSPVIQPLRLGMIVESLRGVWALHEIVHAAPSVAGLVLGAADYANNLGVDVNPESLAPIRARMGMAAASAGIACWDAPYFHYQDLDGLREECRRARAFGFTGKTTIHPSHCKIIEEEFKPSSRAIDFAKRVVAACEERRGGIAVVDGQMVGRPFVANARRVLAAAGEPIPPTQQGDTPQGETA